MEGGKKEKPQRHKSAEGKNTSKPGIAWAHFFCVLLSDSIPDWFCQEIKVVFATQDFAGEMGPIISSSTKDADRESGEGFVESNTDSSESRSWNM